MRKTVWFSYFQHAVRPIRVHFCRSFDRETDADLRQPTWRTGGHSFVKLFSASDRRKGPLTFLSRERELLEVNNSCQWLSGVRLGSASFSCSALCQWALLEAFDFRFCHPWQKQSFPWEVVFRQSWQLFNYNIYPKHRHSKALLWKRSVTPAWFIHERHPR